MRTTKRDQLCGARRAAPFSLSLSRNPECLAEAVSKREIMHY